MSDPKTLLSAAEVEAAELADWRLVMRTLQARFETADFVTGLALVDRIGEAAESAQHHPDLDLGYTSVGVSMSSHDVGGITSRDVDLARTISGFAAEAGAAARPEQLSALELALDTPDHSAIKPFWRALLAYEDGAVDDELVDPTGQGPTVWFQRAEEHETPHQRWHLDLRIPPEVVDARIEAAREAGGSLVSDASAPAYWVLADTQGNQACLTTWQGRGE